MRVMEDVQKLGELLKLPNLDENTIKLINEKMRELIGAAKVQLPATVELTKSIVDEWQNGAKDGE